MIGFLFCAIYLYLQVNQRTQQTLSFSVLWTTTIRHSKITECSRFTNKELLSFCCIGGVAVFKFHNQPINKLYISFCIMFLFLLTRLALLINNKDNFQSPFHQLPLLGGTFGPYVSADRVRVSRSASWWVTAGAVSSRVIGSYCLQELFYWKICISNGFLEVS